MNNSVLGFNGQRLDYVNGTTHLGNGYRTYNPCLKRFHCPDSWSPFGPGGINCYAYCADDPVNRVDSTGHFSLGQWIGLGAGILASIVVSIATEGAAIPAVMAVMASVASEAAIGSGIELATEAIDGQPIDWAQVGIAFGIGAAAGAVGYGLGKGISKISGTINNGIINRTSHLTDGYTLEQVAHWDRVATKGIRRGGLPGGGGALTRCLRPAIESDLPDIKAFLSLPESERTLIGRGVQGSVYEAGNGWAVKTYVSGGGNAEALKREADIFCTVYGKDNAFVKNNMIWMRKIAGRRPSLTDIVSREDRVSMADKINNEVMRLRNELGINYPDSQWNNVLVSDDGKINLIDFGNATYVTDEQRAIWSIPAATANL